MSAEAGGGMSAEPGGGVSAQAGGSGRAGQPAEVVRPTSVEEVADVLRAASVARRRVVLSTSELRGIEVYEPADLTLTAAAGTPLAELEAALGEHGQFLPFDPPQVSSRTLGDLVATGDGGPLSSSYGAPRDHVLGVTMVTGAGTVLKLGGRVMKNVAGFDLVRLVVGSRGSLGVVVSACIRVFPRPAVDRVLVLEGRLPDLLAAGRAVATAPLVPASAVVHASGGAAAVRLVVRLHGSLPVVEADQASLQSRVERPFQALDGEAATGLVDTVRDACSEQPVLLGLTTLPAKLPELLHGCSDALLADVMTGGVRMAPKDTSEAALRSLIGRARDLGGSASFLAASPEVHGLAREPAPTDALAGKLRAAFDPQGVLSTGAPA